MTSAWEVTEADIRIVLQRHFITDRETIDLAIDARRQQKQRDRHDADPGKA